MFRTREGPVSVSVVVAGHSQINISFLKFWTSHFTISVELGSRSVIFPKRILIHFTHMGERYFGLEVSQFKEIAAFTFGDSIGKKVRLQIPLATAEITPYPLPATLENVRFY